MYLNRRECVFVWFFFSVPLFLRIQSIGSSFTCIFHSREYIFGVFYLALHTYSCCCCARDLQRARWNNVFSLKSATAPFSQQNTFCNETCVVSYKKKYLYIFYSNAFLLLLFLRVLNSSYIYILLLSSETLSVVRFLGCIVYHFQFVYCMTTNGATTGYWFLCSFFPFFGF